jgi:imidazole glycerol-phosphate synthase subunit HisH
MGNLHSVKNALVRLGIEHFVSDDIGELKHADGYILPGVGSFKDAMAILREAGMVAFIQEIVEVGKPILGICLGMQLLFESSEENGLTEGLDLLPGQVVRFSGKNADSATYKVPHMGWNELNIHQASSPMMDGISGGFVYFVHSYFVKTEDKDVLVATADYHETVPAVVGRGNVFGAQFHPEKSSEVGLTILTNFGRLVEGSATSE